MNKRKMLVSQWKQEVVACVLHSLEESKRQRDNALSRSRRRSGVGSAEEQRETG